MKILFIIKKFLELILESSKQLFILKLDLGELNALNDEGVATIPNFLTDEQCQEIMDSFDLAVTESPYKDNFWKDPVGSDIRINGFEKIKPELLDFFTRNDHAQKLWSEVEKYASYTINVLKLFVMGNRVLYHVDSLGSGGGWHRDMYNKKQIKFIIYLNDVEEDAGAFQYIPGSHKPLTKLRAFILGRGEYPGKTRYTDSEIQQGEIKTYTAKRGTLVVADTTGIHRGSPITNPEKKRYALTLYSFLGNIPPHIKKQLI
jgi:hypothetical protein